MQSDERIVRYTIEELKEMQRRGESRTDWDRINAMTDDEIEANVDVELEGHFDLSTARPGLPPFEEPIQISVEILHRLTSKGIDPTERINEVMRIYVDTLSTEDDARKQAS